MEINMKICLIYGQNDEYSETKDDWEFSEVTINKINLSMISFLLNKKNIKHDLLFGTQMSVNEMAAKINEGSYDIICFSVFNYNLRSTIRLIQRCLKQKKRPFIILEGNYASMNYKMLFHIFKKFDCIILGESDKTFLSLVNKIIDGEDWRTTEGIVYEEQHELKFTENGKLIENLDIYDGRVYTGGRQGHLVPIESIRGCNGSCSFCIRNTYYSKFKLKKLRQRAAKLVVSEILENVKVCNARTFIFTDDNFLINTEERKLWLDEFIQHLRKSREEILFYANVRVDDFIANINTVIQLNEIGLFQIFLGVESFVQRQLDLFCKNNTVLKNEQALELAKKNDICIGMGFLIMDPYSTLDEIEYNARKLLNADFLDVLMLGVPISSSHVSLIYDSKLYHKVKEDGLIAANQKGYLFVDSQVQLYYEWSMKWREILDPIYNRKYLILKSKYYKDERTYKRMMEIKNEMIRLDLDFIIQACRVLKSENVEITYDVFIKDLRSRGERLIQLTDEVEKSIKEER